MLITELALRFKKYFGGWKKEIKKNCGVEILRKLSNEKYLGVTNRTVKKNIIYGLSPCLMCFSTFSLRLWNEIMD